jgi:hypothetical protein
MNKLVTYIWRKLELGIKSSILVSNISIFPAMVEFKQKYDVCWILHFEIPEMLT